jgi:hypothetical protein
MEAKQIIQLAKKHGSIDVIKCEFAGDDCVVIDTKEWNYLTLSEENLNQLQDLINEAREYLKVKGNIHDKS